MLSLQWARDFPCSSPHSEGPQPPQAPSKLWRNNLLGPDHTSKVLIPSLQWAVWHTRFLAICGFFCLGGICQPIKYPGNLRLIKQLTLFLWCLTVAPCLCSHWEMSCRRQYCVQKCVHRSLLNNFCLFLTLVGDQYLLPFVWLGGYAQPNKLSFLPKQLWQIVFADHLPIISFHQGAGVCGIHSKSIGRPCVAVFVVVRA